MIRESASQASIKGEVILTGRGANMRSTKSRFSNNAAMSNPKKVANTTTAHGQEQIINSSKEFNE